MFERGFKVFPLKPNRKDPLVHGWQQWAESGNEEIILNFSEHHKNCNWGVYVGATSDMVVDIDNKNGKNGSAELKKIEEKHSPLPPTFVIETPTGGFHCYYKGEVRSISNKWAPGIDTKGKGGYVVAPGSVIDGKQYRIISDPPAA